MRVSVSEGGNRPVESQATENKPWAWGLSIPETLYFCQHIFCRCFLLDVLPLAQSPISLTTMFEVTGLVMLEQKLPDFARARNCYNTLAK